MDSLGGATYLTMISCDMIIFIFASGYFSKNVDKSRQKSFRTFLYPYILNVSLYQFFSNSLSNYFLSDQQLYI